MLMGKMAASEDRIRSIIIRENKEIRKGLFLLLAALLLQGIFNGMAHAASSDCKRTCEVWAYGYKEPEPGALTFLPAVSHNRLTIFSI